MIHIFANKVKLKYLINYSLKKDGFACAIIKLVNNYLNK